MISALGCSAGACAGCTVAVLVYDESTLEPVLATTGSGEQVGPLVGLPSP